MLSDRRGHSFGPIGSTHGENVSSVETLAGKATLHETCDEIRESMTGGRRVGILSVDEANEFA